MRTVPAGLALHLQEDVTSIVICWRVIRRDGVLILGTQYDSDVIITVGDLAGTYVAAAGITGSSVRSSSDLSVDNLEVSGAMPKPGDLDIVDLRAADIEAGLMDDAQVTIFMANWKAPDVGQLIIRVGTLGAITRTAEGRYMTELRGMAQRLRQNLIRTYSVTCDAELGDARCRFPLSTVIASGVVDAVTDRSFFDSTLSGVSSGIDSFIGGLLTWVTGDNAGFSMEVKQDAIGAVLGNIQLYEQMPNDIQVGDTFSLSPGCDKTLATCRDRYDNILNFRGAGVLVPGRNKVSVFGET